MFGGLEEALEGLQTHLRIPDLWQQKAIRSLREGNDVIVSAPTGAGKTFVFEVLANEGKPHPQGRQAVFTVPTRALANDKWREWKSAGWNVGIATGDLAENLEAPVIVATLETQRERFLSGNGPWLLVIDEYQMIGDRRRGLHYELAVALAPEDTRLLLMSGSVSNPKRVHEWLERLGRPAEIVETKTRPVPLDEVPIEALPNTAPGKYRNFWQRLALNTLLSDRGPLLIFAPHRRAAEKIAWKVAEVLPEDDPVRVGDREMESICSGDIRRLIRKRVAFHHSGLGFAERAAVVEPLAKAGQLHVIVATMGLAAGINFSVRSVFVSDTHYQDGPFQRDVSPDELLQMFGRAGRRGLDKTGYVVCGDRSPRIHDAHPLELHRQNELDWPTLIRRMFYADEAGESPIEAARELRDRLFSRQQIKLGFRSPFETGAAEGESLFGLTPTRKEIRNGGGEWEPVRAGREARVSLENALSWNRGRYEPAEGDSKLVSRLLPERTRLCRLDAKGEKYRRYGLDLAVATGNEEGFFSLTKAVRKYIGGGKGESSYSIEEAESLLPEALSGVIAPGIFDRLVQRGNGLYLTAHFRSVEVDVYLDSGGRPLVNPERRTVEIETTTHLTDEVSGEVIETAPGTAAHAWRKLRLIDESGTPTSRGVLFSFFQGGEGLAVAAALEDPHYPVDEIILHLSNLRAGHRFELDSVPNAGRLVESVGSERLAAACRQAHGAVDHEGYLRLGLPVQYGEGAAEVISLMLEGKLFTLLAQADSLEFGAGDVERAFVEWLSLLRHIRHAPDLENPRWRELKEAASRELAARDRRSPLASLPELPASVLQKPPRHGIPFRSIRTPS
ncbi:MAG: DEAD/DEAH box helicase [Verrucomicrobiales bacterium]|nr:DEAD/DEAH box helicase [Verrucomicrobiales bacterium]